MTPLDFVDKELVSVLVALAVATAWTAARKWIERQDRQRELEQEWDAKREELIMDLARAQVEKEKKNDDDDGSEE